MSRPLSAFLCASFLAGSLASVPARADEPQRPNGPSVSGQGSIVVQPNPLPSPTYPPASPYPAPAPYPGASPYPVQPGADVVVPGAVPVHVRDDAAGITHRLVTVDGQVLGVCAGNCTFQVPPGTYVLESGETDELRSGKKKIVVSGPTIVEVSPGSKGQRTTGLVLGSIGPVMMIVGLVGVMVVAADHAVQYSCSESGACGSTSESSYTPWVLALVGGVGMTTAGWIMFGVSGTKIRANPYAGPPPFAPQPSPVSVTPIALRGGGGLGVSFTF